MIRNPFFMVYKMKLQRLVKNAIFFGAGAVDSFYLRPPPTLTFNFHSLSGIGPQSIPAENFQSLMEWLFEQRFEFILVRELGQALKQGVLPSHSVCITFDDAFEDILNPLQWFIHRGGRATLFVVADEFGYNHWPSNSSLMPRRQRMNWQQIKSLARAGVEIGSHSYHHPQLTLLDEDQRWQELAGSRGIIQEHLQVTVDSFAYPFGLYDSSLIRTTSAAGYHYGCTAHFYYLSINTNPLMIPRFEVDSLDDLMEITKGGRHLYYRSVAKIHQLRQTFWRL
jgi:peptidoglycan/xylan/chitin deacetylase (PgdA/CDA1 family)